MQRDSEPSLATSVDESLPKQIDFEAGRRAFIKTMGLGAASTAILGGTVVASTSSQAQAAAITDEDILNFALNLEYLEAEFYLLASSGQGLSADEVSGIGTVGPVSGGRKVSFATPAFANYANEIAEHERQHVNTLRKDLRGKAVARPALNLNSSFTTAAQAANLIGPNDTFDAFANETNFLLAAYIFEDVGVTAYHGAAPLIKDARYIPDATGILAVEAYHAGIIRTVLYSLGLFTAANRISNARDSLDGSTNLDQGIGSTTTSNLVPTDNRGIVYERTPQQVLGIVYLSPNATYSSNSFFPNGLNGALR